MKTVGTCFKCREKEIQNVARGLCGNCYLNLRAYYNMLGIPMKLTEKQKKRGSVVRLKKKYGVQALKDLNTLDHRQFWNLVDFGNKYGFTRERARQIYKKIKGRPYGSTRIKKTCERNDETVCPHDPRHKIAEYRLESNIGIAAISENLFYRECIKRGFDVTFCCNGSVDMNVNGYLVDVKMCSNPKPYSEGSITEYFRYVAKGKQTDIANYFACYHPTLKTFFIIPNTNLKKDKNGNITIYISESKSYYQTAVNRYWEYENRWDLLEYRSVVDLYK